MKMLFKLVMSLVLLFAAPAVVQAQFNFATNNGAITITKYTGSGGAVTIPSSTNGWPVTSIGANAFASCSSVSGVTIPGSVTNIGARAFYNCIGLSSVTIPDSVASIGGQAFASCSRLVAITVGALNPFYSTTNGVLFNKNRTTLIQYPGGPSGAYTIPNTVTNIGSYAFFYSPYLTGVTIPSSVSSIGGYAFLDAYSLSGITIPNSVTDIGAYAFSSCYSLTKATLGDSLRSIGINAFSYCDSLASVAIPNSVTNIGDEAFYACPDLITLTIGSGVSSIGIQAFTGCNGLPAITVDALNSFYISVDGVLFNRGQTTLIEYPGAKAGAFTIPNSVTNIVSYAFYRCNNLTSVIIPNSVTCMGDAVFQYCGSLTSVIIGDGLSSLGLVAFASCTNLTTVTIPFGVTNILDSAFNYCINLKQVNLQGNAPGLGGANVFSSVPATVYYLPGTTGWGATFDGRPTAQWFLPNPMILQNSPSYGVQTNSFGFIISWATNIPVVVEACTDLVNATWSPVATNTLTGGSSYFSDPQWTNYPNRFYRLRSP